MTTTLLLAQLLIDGTGAPPLPNPALFIQDGRITRILPQDQLTDSDRRDAQILDYRSHAILPGLIDSHVHLSFNPGPDHDTVRRTLIEDEQRGLLPYRVLHNAQQALLGGITTLRDSGDRKLVTLALRDAINTGLVVAPRLLVSGMPITTTSGHLHYCGLIADTDQQILDAVAMLCEKGVDWVKVIATGGQMTAESDPFGLQYTSAQLQLAVESAHQRRRRVEAHVLNTPAIEACVHVGVDHIAHCIWRNPQGITDYRPELVDKIIRKGIVVEMTVSGYLRHLVIDPTDSPAECQKKLDEMASIAFLEPLRQMWRAGVKIIAHTDAGVRLTDFHTFSRGLQFMAQALGISPLDTIQAATRLPAEALGLADEIGTLQVGKRADLIATAMNPLDDLAALAKIALVMRDGKPLVLDHRIISDK